MNLKSRFNGVDIIENAVLGKTTIEAKFHLPSETQFVTMPEIYGKWRRTSKFEGDLLCVYKRSLEGLKGFPWSLSCHDICRPTGRPNYVYREEL